MTEKILQVVIYEEEDRKLAELAKSQERSKSAMVRFLINREHARLFHQEVIQAEIKSDRG